MSELGNDITPDDIKERELTLRMSRFVVEYLKDCNGTKAAIRAGYSESSAAEIAYENLRKPQIAAKIQEHMEYASSALDITASRVLSALWANHIEADKTSDSNKALELLGRNHKLFTDKFEHSGRIDSKITEVSREMSLEEATRLYEENLRQSDD